MDNAVALVRAYLHAHAELVVRELRRHGAAQVPGGHRVRLIAFGSAPPAQPTVRHEVILLGHVVEFLYAHIRRHWEALRQAQSKDPALGFLMALEKARRGGGIQPQPAAGAAGVARGRP